MGETGTVRETRVLFRRHSLTVRLTHWLNVFFMSVLLFSGLQIFNAHPGLYWGDRSDFSRPWLVMTARQGDGGELEGITAIGGKVFETTGLFGVSDGLYGEPEPQGFPSWLTLPSYHDLATGRRWHFFFAWLFVINGAIYLIYSLVGGHARRHLVPSAAQLRDLGRSILDHMRLRFPHGDEAREYNGLQKLTYLPVVFILLPLIVLTGLAMSPAVTAAFPLLLDVLGGRQSARSIHFICAFLLTLFAVVHVIMVLISGVWNNMRSMITGKYAIVVEPKSDG